MHSAKAIILIATLCAATPVDARAQPRTDSAPPLAVAGMRAFLTHNKTGELSPDVLDAQGGLRNSIVGPNASDAMLVVVELSGQPGAAYNGTGGKPRYKLRLVAREGKQRVVVHDRTVPIPVLNDRGRVYVSFLVRQDGCLPIRLSASIVGLRGAKTLERSQTFSCGE